MLTRKNIKNGDDLSILGFGCMRYPMKGNSIDESRTIALIRDAISKGVNYFDTAYIYHNGKSESILGDALSGGFREKVKIATKLPCFMVKNLDSAKKIFNKQIERLKTDYIDYYLLHMLTDKASFDRMDKAGIVNWLEQQKKAGIIKNFGFSFHGSKSDFEDLIKVYDWDFCQIQYNYIDENNQATKSGLQLAASMGIPVMIMEPLRGGKLVNRLPKEILDEFNSSNHNWTPAEWGLRWVWNHPEVTLLLSGMSDESQSTENIRIASDAHENALTQEDLKVFDKVKTILLEKTKVPCTACGYCMPCPSGVNIPGCFSAYNSRFLLKEKKYKYMQTLGFLSKTPAFASRCIECGKCEQHCPQHIEIRKELKNVSREMEGFAFKPIVWIVRKIVRIG